MTSGSAFLPPKHFNFATMEEWPKWICKFEQLKDSSNFDEKGEQKQVSSVIYTMGEEAADYYNFSG